MCTINDPTNRSWLRAIEDAAKEQAIPLPAFAGHGMGTARTLSSADGRFITFKRRLVKPQQAELDGVEWTLWREQDGLPRPVAAFREPLLPNPENIANALSLFKGWLIDGWSPDVAKTAVEGHPRKQQVDDTPSAELKAVRRTGDVTPPTLRLDQEDVGHLASQPGDMSRT